MAIITKLGANKKKMNSAEIRIYIWKRNMRTHIRNNIHTKTNDATKPNGTVKEEYNKINKKEENGCPELKLIMGNFT